MIIPSFTLGRWRNRVAAIVLPLTLIACSGMSKQDRNTATGAGVGAVGGTALTGGSTMGTIGGAAIGRVTATARSILDARLKALRSSLARWASLPPILLIPAVSLAVVNLGGI